MLRKGTKLDKNRYTIGNPLGVGGMGAVWVARDDRLGCDVAIKETRINERNKTKKQKLVKQFKSEAWLLANLHHENIPQVKDYFVQENEQFLVMEFVDGKDLHTILEETKTPFTLIEVLKWANQILDALEYLHSQKKPVIHKDIKPGNLKVTERRQIKLLDFGIAKGFVDGMTPIHGSIPLGTPSYSPIEQFIKFDQAKDLQQALSENYKKNVDELIKQETDARSDIYSLSVTLYKLLANRLPSSEGFYPRAIAVWANRDDPIIPLTKINSTIPEIVSEVLMKGMALEAKDRHQSAKEMRVELNKAWQEHITAEETAKRENERKLIEINTNKKIDAIVRQKDSEINKILEQSKTDRFFLEKELAEKLKVVEQEKVSLENRISNVREKWTDSLKKCESLESSLKTKDTNIADLQTHNIQLERQLENELRKVTNNFPQRGKMYNQIENQIQVQKNLINEIVDLKNQLHSQIEKQAISQNKIISLQNSLTEKEKENNSLAARVINIKSENSNLLKVRDDEITQLKKLNNELSQNLETDVMNHRNAEEKLAQTQFDNKALQSERATIISSVNNELKAKEEQIEDLVKQINELKAKTDKQKLKKSNVFFRNIFLGLLLSILGILSLAGIFNLTKNTNLSNFSTNTLISNKPINNTSPSNTIKPSMNTATNSAPAISYDIPDIQSNVESFNLYEGSEGVTNSSQYTTTFNSKKTRYIYYNIVLSNTTDSDKKITVIANWYNAKNNKVLHRDKNSIWTNWGRGNEKAGSWKVGKYRLEISYKGKVIAKTDFEVK